MATTRAAATAAGAPAIPVAAHAQYANLFTSLSDCIQKVDGSMANGKINYFAWIFRILRILKE